MKENKEIALDFANWLMDNCELADDNSLWSYQSEDYDLEGLYAIYKTSINFCGCKESECNYPHKNPTDKQNKDTINVEEYLPPNQTR